MIVLRNGNPGALREHGVVHDSMCILAPRKVRLVAESRYNRYSRSLVTYVAYLNIHFGTINTINKTL